MTPGNPTTRSRRLPGGPAVLAALQRRGPLTQVALAAETGLTEASISFLVRDLSAADVLAVARTVREGRPSNLVSLTRAVGVVAGIDLGHRHIAVAVADFARTVLAEEWVELDDERPRSEITERTIGQLERVIRRAGVVDGDLTAIGLGLPGPLAEDHRQVVAGTILPDWVGYQPAQFLQQRYPGIPVLVDNDANLGALGEHQWGAGQGYDDLLYVKLSTGVGAGLIFGGNIFRGWKGTAGEIGHLQVAPYGQRCACGHYGCLETVLGLGHLLPRLRRPGEAVPGMSTIADRLAAGDDETVHELTRAAQALGDVLAVLITTLSPRMVIVGGTALELGPLLLSVARERARERVLPALIQEVRLVTGRLDHRAELLGALSAAAAAARLPAPGPRRAESLAHRSESPPA